ncbi:hypothetical protein [Nostoc sp.]
MNKWLAVILGTSRSPLTHARCFSLPETLRVACFPEGVQVGKAAQRTGSP